MYARLMTALFLTLASSGFAAADDAEGKSIFSTKCAICHGPNGDGNTTIGKTLNVPYFHSARRKR